MTREIESKMPTVIAFASQGTGVGTSSIIDTSAWQAVQIMALHGGTGGSRTINVFANAGTQYGTASTTMPNLVFVGSANSDFAGAGSPVWHCGSLTHQAIMTVGTSSNSSFTVSYKLYE